MLKKLILLFVLLAVLAACTAEEPGEPAQSPSAEATPESAVAPVEEGVTEEATSPDVTVVPPSGSVDLDELTPDAGMEGADDLIEQPAPGVPDPQATLVKLAIQDLADRLGIEFGSVTLVEAVARDWPDAGLGCPSPGLMYAAVITPGYQITLEAQGEIYDYHTDLVDTLVLCVDGQPAVE